MKMEEMLWIEDIVESPSTPLFWTNSRVDMVGFVYSLTRWLQGVQFQPIEVHEMELNWKMR
jgi:hypothetical protein